MAVKCVQCSAHLWRSTDTSHRRLKNVEGRCSTSALLNDNRTLTFSCVLANAWLSMVVIFNTKTQFENLSISHSYTSYPPNLSFYKSFVAVVPRGLANCLCEIVTLWKILHFLVTQMDKLFHSRLLFQHFLYTNKWIWKLRIEVKMLVVAGVEPRLSQCWHFALSNFLKEICNFYIFF